MEGQGKSTITRSAAKQNAKTGLVMYATDQAGSKKKVDMKASTFEWLIEIRKEGSTTMQTENQALKMQNMQVKICQLETEPSELRMAYDTAKKTVLNQAARENGIHEQRKFTMIG